MTREDAIDIIQSILDKYEEDECLATEITIGDEDIKAFKMAIKSLEQEPRKGHWIGDYQVDFGEWQEYDVKLSDGFVTDNCHCSECGEELLSGDRGMFCPYCGADMRGKE